MRSLLSSPSTIYAALSMAHEEIRDIKTLDEELLRKHKHRLHFYFADDDDWVGKHKDVILRVFQDEPDAIKVVHGHQDIPHAFCISELGQDITYDILAHPFTPDHGENVAHQCYEWLVQSRLV